MRYQSIFRSDLFAGQTILVTGGGSGIGRMIAHELASLGAHVLIAARKQPRLEETAEEIEEMGGRCTPYIVNIRDEESVKGLWRTVVAEHGVVHALVNNAGGQFPSPAENISKKGWHAVVETNLTGSFMMCREAFQHTMKENGGAIVGIVAEVGRGFPGMVHTGAARAGVINFTQTLAVEWAQYQVRVNAVAPGVIYGHGITQYDQAFVDSFINQASRDIPMRRMGTEAEIASAVTYLLSPAASYITGETVSVDGGSRLWRKTWDIPDHDGTAPYQGLEGS